MIKIRNRAVGIYWCDFRALNGKRVRKSLGTVDRKEAKQLEAVLMAKLEEKVSKATVGVTLSEAFRLAMRTREEWLAAKAKHSINQVYGMVEEHFKASCTLASIDDDVMLEYVEDLQDSGLAASTINKRTSMISVLFDVAIERKKYDGKKPSIVRLKAANGRRRLITPAEEATAISLCNPTSPYESAMADLIVVLADTGLRLSEALRIQPRNVNVADRAVLVLDTKNNDDRIVPLTDRALEVLTRRTASPVFQPADKHVLSHIWRRIRAKMGLQDDKEFVLHAFRHTYGSTLANAGVDAFRIQKVMGHKVIATTQRYVKVATSALDGLSQIMQDRCAPACVQKSPDMVTDEWKSLGNPVLDRTVNPQVPGSSPGRGAIATSGISISYTLPTTGSKYGY